jgi:ubiquinone/menaquinone biosynthesis C-methylase UbiE
MTTRDHREVKQDVRDWWSQNPQTYSTVHGETRHEGGVPTELGSREFFEGVDREFYRWNQSLHGEHPFERLFPYQRYQNGAKVLEVGCGMGTMAMNWAKRGAAVTAVDLSPTSVRQTTARFALFGLPGEIRQEDGNRLSFGDRTFDYAYSWGVLHHSPDLDRSIRELMRVLKPGGGFMVMLYHRHSLLHLYRNLYREGFLHYERRFLTPLELTSRYGDADTEEGNPHTWPVTRREMRALFGQFSSDLRLRVLGTDLDALATWMWPGLYKLVPRWLIKPWARRFGWSLVMEGHRSG